MHSWHFLIHWHPNTRCSFPLRRLFRELTHSRSHSTPTFIHQQASRNPFMLGTGLQWNYDHDIHFLRTLLNNGNFQSPSTSDVHNHFCLGIKLQRRKPLIQASIIPDKSQHGSKHGASTERRESQTREHPVVLTTIPSLQLSVIPTTLLLMITVAPPSYGTSSCYSLQDGLLTGLFYSITSYRYVDCLVLAATASKSMGIIIVPEFPPHFSSNITAS